MMEPIGIEPTTSWLQARCSAKLSYSPEMDRGGSRTRNLWLATPALSQIELRAHDAHERARTSDLRHVAPMLFLLSYMCSSPALPVPPAKGSKVAATMFLAKSRRAPDRA